MGSGSDEVGGMVLGNRGYVFTLITAMLVLIILSMIMFFTEVSAPSYEDSSNRMSVDELHFYVESVKKDASRAISISGQRASAYAIDHIILTNETYGGYAMDNCTGFNYSLSGVEAALAELMVCGTLDNAEEPTGNIRKYMLNNTVLSWTRRMGVNQTGGLPYNVTVKFRNMSMGQYDPWHYVIVSEFDLLVRDLSSNNEYRGYGIPVVSTVDVSTLEDPSFHIQYDIPAELRILEECGREGVVDGEVLDLWIDEGCYHGSGNRYNAPSFFDRLEGRTSLSQKYVLRSRELLEDLGYEIEEIGLESLVNVDFLRDYNVSVNTNLSQVDYMYWNGVESTCGVSGMEKHPNFRIDVDHAVKYGVRGLNCEVGIDQDLDLEDFFTPDTITVPVNTTLTWVDHSGVDGGHELYIIPNAWVGTKNVPANGRFQWFFNETGDYTVICTSEDHDGFFPIHVMAGVE
ncbi:MAG: hypothetical protein GF416_00355 [Candidatus Altiarchaeales archaeon]|nr:hypothetical protein [Candidatus Altiarchaeales archaeon]MBD3415571.1 hypothetical protein [Candidatus Altiarchaeales archaeon]